jgi:DNA-binding transcriptional regulator YiaG
MDVIEIVKKSGMSKAQFCRKYNIPYVTLMHWQSGYSKPPKYVETILKMLVMGDDKHE